MTPISVFIEPYIDGKRKYIEWWNNLASTLILDQSTQKTNNQWKSISHTFILTNDIIIKSIASMLIETKLSLYEEMKNQ